MDKVILTKAQVESIESKIKNHPRERVIRDFVTATKVNGSLDGITLDMLNRALYIGYEVEQTLEEKLHEAFEDTPPSLPNPSWTDEDNVRMSYQCGFRTALRTAGIKVPGIND